MQVEGVTVIPADEGGALQCVRHGFGADDIHGVGLKRRIKERMRASIFIGGLNGAEPRQAVVSGDAVAALVKRLEVIVEGHAPAIVPSLAVLEERLQSLILEVVAQQAGLRQADDSTRRLDARDGVQALAHPERAIRTMADRVHELVGIAHAEAGHQDLRLVRLPVAIGVSQLDESVEITDQDGSVADLIGEWLDALDHRKPFSKAHGLIGFAVPIGIFQAKNIVTRLHARNGLRIGRRTADVQTALGVPRHLGRLGDAQVFVGEEVYLETIGDLEGGLLFRGSHNLLGADDWTSLRGRRGGRLAAG